MYSFSYAFAYYDESHIISTFLKILKKMQLLIQKKILIMCGDKITGIVFQKYEFVCAFYNLHRKVLY